MEQNIDLTKLSDKDKQELNQVLTNEAQKSNIQQSEFLTLLGTGASA
jgi:import inner membrane translocase subunit TIM8